jgi:hypothetical protein
MTPSERAEAIGFAVAHRAASGERGPSASGLNAEFGEINRMPLPGLNNSALLTVVKSTCLFTEADRRSGDEVGYLPFGTMVTFSIDVEGHVLAVEYRIR